MGSRFLLLLFFLPVAVAAESLDLGDGLAIELIAVAAGEATIGSPSDEHGRGADEPTRTVRISQAFLIGRAPVTRGQFARFVAATSYRSEAETGNSGGWGLVDKALVQRPGFSWRNPGFAQDDHHPVVLVTWKDANAFCAWASGLGRFAIALPSEAEWEFACRGGPGGTWNRSVAATGLGTRAVGEDLAHPLGLTDLLGQVNQWCRDWYIPVPPGDAVDPEAQAGGGTLRRCLRGGSFLGGGERNRPAARWRNTPGTRNADNGFRIIARRRLVEELPTVPAVPSP